FKSTERSAMMKFVRMLVLVTLSIVVLSPAGLAAPAPDAQGPYPVGVTTVLLTDHSRTCIATGGPRSLLTEIWYPATDDTAKLPPGNLMDYFRGADPQVIAGLMKAAFGADMLEAAKTFKTISVRDARIRDGKFPLLLFSHGNGGMRSQGVFWCEHMASHGYIVAAPDHTGNSGVTVLGGELVVFNAELRKPSGEERPKDIRFLIDAFTGMNKGDDSRFYERVDLEHIGVAGHSYGGYTATRVADADPRVDAIAPWAAVAQERENYEIPVMAVVATEDDTIDAEGNARIRQYYEESKGPKYLVEFVNGGHYSFTEMYQWNPSFGDGVGSGTRITNGEPIEYVGMHKAFSLLNGYTTAFFGRYLKDLKEYEEYLKVNHDSKELIYKFATPD
ncbi:MAG: alpha/beta hydrolase, partial [Candidatus Hydrogenedentes bacterium]|nr:alpha/beta hydrolase [Candidatus Hydrogenedentota bacterium]